MKIGEHAAFFSEEVFATLAETALSIEMLPACMCNLFNIVVYLKSVN